MNLYVPVRPMMKNLKGYNLVGVEIGVRDGLNAFSILKHCSIMKLFLIDPYSSYHEPGQVLDDASQKKYYPLACNRLKKFNNKIEFIIMKSENAVDKIPDNLDFVYIDGNHSYDFVRKDIELYYPKVKVGGVIGGHDWSDKDVAKSVLDFCDKYGLYELLNVRPPDWWIVKEEDIFRNRKDK